MLDLLDNRECGGVDRATLVRCALPILKSDAISAGQPACGAIQRRRPHLWRESTPRGERHQTCRTFQLAHVLWLPGLIGKALDGNHCAIGLMIRRENSVRETVRDGHDHGLARSVLLLTGGHCHLARCHSSRARAAANRSRHTAPREKHKPSDESDHEAVVVLPTCPRRSRADPSRVHRHVRILPFRSLVIGPPDEEGESKALGDGFPQHPSASVRPVVLKPLCAHG